MTVSRAKSLFIAGGLLTTMLVLTGCETTESNAQTDYYYRYGVYGNDWRYRPNPPRPPDRPVKPVHPIQPTPPVRPTPPIYRPPIRPSPKPSPRPASSRR